MAVDQTTAFQQIVDSDPELQRLIAQAQATPGGFQTTYQPSMRGAPLTGARRGSRDLETQIMARKRVLGIGEDYGIDPRTGQVQRSGALGRNLDWIGPAAVAIPTLGTSLLAGGGPAAVTGGGAAAPEATFATTSTALPEITTASGISSGAANAGRSLWSRAGDALTQDKNGSGKWSDLGRVLGGVGQTMADNRGAENQENYLRDAMLLNARSREAELEHTYRDDAKKDIRRSDYDNSWTPTERPAGVPTISFTHGPGPQQKASDQLLATQGQDRLSKPPVGMGTVDPNNPNQVLPYATTPPKKPSAWERMASYAGPAASILDWIF